MIPAPQTASTQVEQLTGKKPRRITILDTAVCVRVKFGRIGTSRKVKKTSSITQEIDQETGETHEVEKKVFTVDAEEKLIRVSKKLLDSPEMDALNQLDSEIRKYIRSRVLESGIDDGLYWISLKKEVIDEFETQMKAYFTRIVELVNNLAEAYEGIVQTDQERLRGAFDPEDYLTPAEVKDKFRMTWQYITFTTPRSLEAVSEELYRKAQEDLNITIQLAQDAVQLALRTEMAELVDWAIDRLSPGENGKRKILRSKTKTGEEIGLIKRLHEFFGTFSGRNITNDYELQNLVSKAEAIMTGVDVDALKKSDSLRDSVMQSFAELKSELEPLIVEAPNRDIDV